MGPWSRVVPGPWSRDHGPGTIAGLEPLTIYQANLFVEGVLRLPSLRGLDVLLRTEFKVATCNRGGILGGYLY